VATTITAPAVPPNRSHPGVIVKPRKRRRWLPVLAVLVLLSVVAGVVYVTQRRPDLLSYVGLKPTTSAPTGYSRAASPSWLPPGYSKIVDDEQDQSVVSGEATNGGTCTYDRRGRLHVVRNNFDVSGCVAQQYIKDLVVFDAAIEAELSIVKGCAGMWVRTGSKGYFLAVCHDKSIRLHKLFDAPASEQNLLVKYTPTFDPKKVVVGLLVRGTTLTVYVDGQALKPTPSDAEIKSGRVGVGGFAPAPENSMDATIIQFRAWAPPSPSPSP